MQFLRTIFWVALAVLGVVFSVNNWTQVPVRVWPGVELLFQLPFLLLIVFLVGLVPPWVLHRVTRWSMNRKLEAANRSLVETRTALEPTASPPSVMP